MKRVFLLLTAFLMVQTTGTTASLWEARPVKQWTREETERFLRDSSWVEHVTTLSLAALSVNSGERERREGSLGGDLESAEAQRLRQRAIYFVEWSSAKVVRRANWHFQALMGQAVNQDVEPPALPLYVLTVKGVYLAAFANLSRAEVMKEASLRLKHLRTTLQATDAVVRKTPEGKVVAVQLASPRLLDGMPTIPPRRKRLSSSAKPEV